MKTLFCYSCGRIGHIANHCKIGIKNKEVMNLMEKEEGRTQEWTVLQKDQTQKTKTQMQICKNSLFKQSPNKNWPKLKEALL